jgi:amino acid transporter
VVRAAGGRLDGLIDPNVGTNEGGGFAVGSDGQELGYERLGAKRLTLVDVIAQSFGFIAPVFSAAFLIPLIAGAGAAGRGAGAATPFAVILAAIGVFALGWIVAQYAKRVHAAGSLYDYVRMGLGQSVGAVAGWVYYGGTTMLTSAVAVLIGGYVHDILQQEYNLQPLPGWLWSALFVAAVFTVLYLGVQISTRAQLTLALVSAAALLVFFISVIVQTNTNSVRAFNPGSASDGLPGVLFGVIYGVLIFVGFETAANLAEETAEPKREIPRAVLLSVAIVAAYYVVAAYAQVAGFNFDIKTFTSAEVFGTGPILVLGSGSADAGPFGYGSTVIRQFLEVVILLDIMAVGLGTATASTRGVFALARDRRIPSPLATVTSRGTPIGSLVFVEAMSLLMVGLAYWTRSLFQLPDTPAALHYFSLFVWLSTFGGFALLVVYALMALGAFRGLADHANRAGVWVAGLLGLAISLGGVWGGIYRVPAPANLVWVYCLAWLLLGVLVTLVVKGREPATHVLADLSSGPSTEI